MESESQPLREIGGKTRVFCVLGHPIGHSLSPAMHNAALTAMGVDGVYVAFDVPPAGLAAAVDGLQALGVGGINCTIPHKEAVIPLLDELSPEAVLIGAVNTIVFRDGRRIGYNTDAPGFLAALLAAAGEPGGKRAVVLGAGGSARAVAAALIGAGARVDVVNRTQARAEALAAELGDKLKTRRVRAVPPDEVGEALAGAELLINTTSVGMSPDAGAPPPVPAEALHPGLLVYDLIYNPLETRLLRAARDCGARTANGAGMLAHQGAIALELWTGRPAPADLMERVIVEKLGSLNP